MKKSLRNLVKAILIAVIALQLVCAQSVFAIDNSNFRLFSIEDSKKDTIVNQDGRMMLKQDWYGMKFEVNPLLSFGTRKLRAVNIAVYDKALHEVNFDLSNFGEYRVYFLDNKLKNYSNAMALSFTDNSVVVFGEYYNLNDAEVARMATHELGHAVDFKLMNDEKWAKYKEIRGITDESIYNNNSAIYSNRPQEIFAEDFRMVCGNDLAKSIPHLNKTLGNPNNNKEVVEFFKNFSNE